MHLYVYKDMPRPLEVFGPNLVLSAWGMVFVINVYRSIYHFL